MVLDEMVEQVSTGVVQELRSLGVPIWQKQLQQSTIFG
jgi:hypothetical protein